MKHAVSRDLFTYWNTLRAGRTAPERCDVDPAAIRHILAYTFILEVAGSAPSREVTIRLSGTRLNALFRCELKGRSLDDLWAGDEAAMARAMIDGVLDDRVGMVAGVRAAPAGCAAVDLELVILPLRHHGRTHVRLLGSLAAISAPSWIGLRPITGLELISFRTLLPTEAETALPRFGPGHVAGCSVGSITQAPIAVEQVGGFRVYQGGRRTGLRAEIGG